MPAKNQICAPPTCSTTDPNFAACLMAVGIPLLPAGVSLVVGDADLLKFHFMSQNDEGLTFRECASAWAQKEAFIESNPQHCMSFAMATIANRRGLDDYLRKAKPKVCIKKGSSIAVVDPGMPQHQSDFILARIGA